MRPRFKAPRAMVVFHALLAATLITLIVHNASTAWDRHTLAAGTRATLPAAAFRIVRTQDNGRARLVVDFGTEMVAPDEVGSAPPAGTLQLDPETPCALRWKTQAQLVLVPVRGLQPARTYRVRLAETLRARDGRAVPKDCALQFATDPVQLTGVQVREDEEDRRVVTLVFDQPLAPKSLEQALAVHNGATTEPTIPVRLRCDDEQGKVWQVEIDAHDRKAGTIGDRVTLVLDRMLTPRDGDVPLGETLTREVRFDEEVHVLECVAREDGPELILDRRVPLPEKGFLEVAPPVVFQLRRTDRGLKLAGEHKPGTSLAITLKRGFPGSGRHRLTEDQRRVVHLPDLSPSVAFAQHGRILSALARPELEIEGVNLAACEVAVQEVYPNNLVRLVQERWPPMERLAGPESRMRVAVQAARNERFRERLDLARVLGHEPRGVLRVTLRDPEHTTDPCTRLLQVTDLGLTVRAAPDAIAVHVRSLARGTPVVGALVRALTPTNQVLAEQESDAHGLAVLRYRRTAADRVPLLVEARAGLDLSFVDFRGDGVELADEGLGGRDYAAGVEAFIAPERGLFRPGEVLRAAVVVRDPTGAAPADMALQARWFAPNGTLRRTENLTVPGTGLLALALDTAAASATGLWRLELHDRSRDALVGSERFRVEAFVPDRLEAKVAAAALLVQGETSEVQVSGRWLEGSPAAGQPVLVRVRLDHGTFAPAGFEGFTFGSGQEGSPPGALPVVQTALGADGTMRVRCDVPRSPNGAPLLARIEAEVQDPSGRAVHAATQALALRGAGQPGLRVHDGKAELVLVQPDGTLANRNDEVEVELLRRRWESHLEGSGSGRCSWRTEVHSEVLEQHRVALQHGRATVTLARAGEPQTGGWLSARLLAGDAVAEHTLGPRPQRPDRLRVTTLGGPVAAGGEARLQIDAPAAGTGLVTLEGTTIHQTRILTLSAGRNECTVRIPAGLTLPNVHAVVTFTAPQARAGAAGPFHLAGGASIQLLHPDRESRVALQAPPEALPEAEVTFDLHAPGALAAHVALVDEGILQRTGFKSPDPLAWFLAPRKLDTDGADSGTSLLGDARFDPAVEAGGDGGDELAARMAGTETLQIRTVALSTGTFALDAQGRGKARLRLPPYEGRLRAMVIAAGSRALGAAQSSIVVRAPLGLMLATPRVLAPGDATELVLTVRNSTGAAGTASIAIEPLGQRFDAELQPGALRSLPVAWTAPQVSGPVELTVTARLGEHTRRITERILVRPLAAYVNDQLGFAADGTTELRVPGTWVPGTLRARLLVDGEPDAQLLPVLSSLLQYPYGCLEQTTSRAYGLLACRNLLPQLLPEGGDSAALAMVQSATDRLWSMQGHTGGLGWWPGDQEPYPYGSVHALDFLLQCKLAGIPLAEDNLKRLVRYVARVLDQGEMDEGLLCAAAEVLTRAGHPVQDWLVRLQGIARCREDRCRLALGFAQLGQPQTARALLSAAGEDLAARERQGLLRSPLRTTALELRARNAADPADTQLPVLAERLCAAVRRAGSLTTQEQAHALLALNEFWRAHSPRGGDPLRGVVEVNGKRQEFAGRARIPLEVAGGDVVRVTGLTGRVFGCLELSGHRTDPDDTPPAGLRITRTLLDPETGKPPEFLRRGQVYVAELLVTSAEPLTNVLLTDLLPGGFELESEAEPAPRQGRRPAEFTPSRVERRDDRLLVFSTAGLRGELRFQHRVRAVFPGTFALPPASIEELYTPGLRAMSQGGERVVVRP